MNPHLLKTIQRKRRQLRVRKKVAGTSERPRLAVFRSSRHTYAQIIDDTLGRTLVSASSMEPELRQSFAAGGNIPAATAVGKKLGERANAEGIQQVSFDRRHYKYHGRIKALADAVRESGVSF